MGICIVVDVAKAHLDWFGSCMGSTLIEWCWNPPGNMNDFCSKCWGMKASRLSE